MILLKILTSIFIIIGKDISIHKTDKTNSDNCCSIKVGDGAESVFDNLKPVAEICL